MTEQREDVGVDQGRDWWRLAAGVLLVIAVAAFATASAGEADSSVTTIAVVAAVTALLTWLRRRH